MAVDFLAVGNFTKDRTSTGFTLGGTVAYAAVTAQRLGWQPGILTRGALDGLLPKGVPCGSLGASSTVKELLEGVSVRLLPSPVTTTFTNLYRDGRGQQVIEAVAAPVTPADLPPAWRTVPVVLLGPVARELPSSWARAFPQSLVGITPQGLMREWDASGHVRAASWEDRDPYLQHADAIILGREDVGNDAETIASLVRRTRLLVVTDGLLGATVYQSDGGRHFPARPTKEVDPTGAGDVFAAAFLIRLSETGDPAIAARFANVVASFSIEGQGMSTIPWRSRVDAWLEAESLQTRNLPAGASVVTGQGLSTQAS